MILNSAIDLDSFWLYFNLQRLFLNKILSLLYQLSAYLKFLKAAVNQHGIHSPFVFDLVTQCIYKKTPLHTKQQLSTYRKSLLTNNERITIQDFGAGSKSFKSNQRTISKIAKTSGSTFKKTKLLYRLGDYFKPKAILELGTSVGIGTHALALSCPHAHMTTIEGSETLSQIAKEQLSLLNLHHIDFKVGPFKTELQQLHPHKYDLIFFDGHHDEAATLTYVDMLLSTAHNDTLWIFDDIYWSKGMTNAWESIKSHEQVTVTLDLFHFGLVFFRKEQAKEHFKIRF